MKGTLIWPSAPSPGLLQAPRDVRVATAASADRDTAALITLGFSAVSQAEQMRHWCGEALRRRGCGTVERARVRSLRLAVEDVLRGSGERDVVAAELALARSRARRLPCGARTRSAFR